MSKISVTKLADSLNDVTLIDVRKPAARAASGLSIEKAAWRHPFDALRWIDQIDRHRKIVVFCVHGHEVSQAVHSFLRDDGIDASYLEGGFDAWREAGHNVVPNDGD